MVGCVTDQQFFESTMPRESRFVVRQRQCPGARTAAGSAAAALYLRMARRAAVCVARVRAGTVAHAACHVAAVKPIASLAPLVALALVRGAGADL